jgi:hypothetical protein
MDDFVFGMISFSWGGLILYTWIVRMFPFGHDATGPAQNAAVCLAFIFILNGVQRMRKLMEV